MKNLYAFSAFHKVLVLFFLLNFGSVQLRAQCSAYFTYDTCCTMCPVHFTDLSVAGAGDAIVSWSWDFGDVGTSAMPNPVHVYSTAGTYNVTLIIGTANNCQDTIMRPVTVLSYPVASFTSSAVCVGYSTSFTDLSIANANSLVSWFWDFGDGFTSTDQNPSHTYALSGMYMVILTVINSNGCSDDTSMIIEVSPSPVANFSDSSHCTYNVYFTDLSIANCGSIVSWSWNFGDGGISTAQSPVHTYASYGNYNVSLIVVNSCGCIDSAEREITVLAAPVSDFSYASTGDYTIQFTDHSTIAAGQTISEWFWDFGDGTTSMLQNPEHVYNGAGTYQVGLIIQCDCGSVDTARKDIKVPETFGITRNEIQQDFLYINPNPFNDKVEINFKLLQPSDVQLEIANMAGAVVKEMPVKHLAAGSRQVVWDADGAEPGIYFLRMSVNNKIYTRKIIKSR